MPVFLSLTTGNLYYLLDNKGEVSIVRPVGDATAEPTDMKVTDWDIVSSTPIDAYVARNTVSMAEGERNPLIQRVNRYRAEEYGFDRQGGNGRESNTNQTRYEGQPNGSVTDLDRIEDVGSVPQEQRSPELPLELESGERVAPAERVEAPASESPVSLEGTAALREGDTAYLGEEPVVVRAISEDGQTAMIEIGGDMMEVSTADLNPAAPAVEEGAMPSESTVESVPTTDAIQPETGESAVLPDESQPSVTPEPQPEEERPPLPTQKNGEVDYNTLLEQDPARFIEEWDKVEGPGAGVEAIMGARESVNSQIEKIQKTLETPSADFNKRAADRKKLQELQAKKEAMDRAIAPYEQAVDVVDEMVANGDIPGLGEQSVPTSTEAPASVEAPAPAEEIVSVEDVEIPENNSANSQDIQPVGSGDFGEIYDQFRGDAQGAIAFLMQKRGGEALGALSHKDVGDIALVYGNEKSGLRKIAEKHPEVLDKLQDILNDMEIVSESDNRIKLESDGYYAVISKDYFGKKRDAWLLTAFEKKNSASDNTMDTAGTLTGEGNDTATSQDTVSGNKDNVPLSNIQTSSEENSQPIAETPKPQPIKETPKPKTSKPKTKDIVAERKAKVDKKFTLYNYALDPKDHNAQFRPVMTGVFLDPDGGWAVSTDGFVMVAAKAPYDPNYAGKIVDRNGGEIESTLPYPKWQKIFAPEKDLVPAGLDYETVYKQLAALEKAKKELPIDFKEARLKKSEIAIVFPITVNGKTKWYKADNLQRFVDAMLHFGVKASDIMENKGELRALQVNTDEVRGALMPLRLTQADFQEGRYIYLDPKSGEVEISKDLQHYIADFPLRPKEGGNTPKFQKNAKDKYDNPIGDGSWHHPHKVEDFSEYPQITAQVQKSSSTESSYVVYHNKENGKYATVRFSFHSNNAVENGVQINGNGADVRNEILFRLGIIDRRFIPNTEVVVPKRAISKADISNYEVAPLTIKQIEALGKDADISEYKGKLAKDSNYLITGDKNYERKTGYGDFEYTPIQKELPERDMGRAIRDAVSEKIEQNGIPVIVDEKEGQAIIDVAKELELRKHAVFHGSGSLFEEFDHSHMGEGEGAQMYGWGTYVTEVKGIGKSYANTSAKRSPELQKEYDDKMNQLEEAAREDNFLSGRFSVLADYRLSYDTLKKLSDIELDAFFRRALDIQKRYPDFDVRTAIPPELANQPNSVFVTIEFLLGHNGDSYMDEFKKTGVTKILRERIERAYKIVERQLEGIEAERDRLSLRISKLTNELGNPKYNPSSYLYEVEIPDDNGNNYITYDKELSPEQKKQLKDAIRERLLADPESGYNEKNLRELNEDLDRSFDNIYGNDVEGTVQDWLGMSDKEAAEFLSSLGYTGIKYPAEYRSGGREDNASNYVIFKEKDLKIKSSITLFKSPDGLTIYGFTKDGKIYLDPNAPADTPIHEYTHLWSEMFRKINPNEWKNIIKLMKGTDLWEKVKKTYPELTEESDIAEEVLSHYSGKRGAERIEAEMKRIRGDKSMSASMKMKALQALHNLRMALDKFWKTIAEYLGMKFTTAEEVADRVLADIERGINPREVMKKVSESNRQVVKAREVLDYFKSKGFKNGEIIRSITDHGVSTYIYGDWGTGYLTKYRISDHGMGAFRAATEISFHQDTNPQTLYRLGAGRMAPSGEQQQQRLSEGNEIAQLWEKHEEELSGYDFQKQQTPLDLKEAIEKYPVLGRAKYLQQRVSSDGKFTYEYSVPHSSGKNPQRPSLGMLRGIDSENPGGNIRATEIREQRELDTPLGRKLNEAGPTKKELVAEAKRKMPDTKIVDKNGEPLVVYHDTNSKMYVNKETGENWENLDWKAKEVWRERDDWDEHWEERDFYTFDNKGHGRESIEMPAFFFTPNPDPYHEYGERRISAFLNIKNPAINPNIENAGVTNTAGRDAMNKLIEQGYDGIIRTNDAGEIEEVAAFFPEQIKSADPITYDDNGNPIPLEDRFDSSKSDIRFSKPLEERLDKALSETGEKIEAAQATRRAKLDEINEKVKKVHKYLRDYMKKNLAQSAQRGYDKETVKAVTDLAKDLIKEKLIDTESLRGLNSLLTTISHVTGRESIKSSVMGIMNIVASNQIRNEKEYFNELLKTKGMKINSNGVKVQGRVDVFTQNYLKALNESKDMERADIQDLYDRALDEYSKAPGDDVRTRGLYAGYSGAMDYADQVRAAQSALKARENHIEATRKQMWSDYEAHKGTEEGKWRMKAYKEFLDASRDEMLRARLNLADDFRSFNNQVATYIKTGKSEAKDFKARELEHIDKIHHYANSDLKGREVSDQPNKGNIATNNPVTRVFLSSLPTFEMFMKLFGRKSTRGEGNLYNHFVRGFQDADDAEYTNLDNSLETIKKKGKEIFGRNTRLGAVAFQSERGIGIKVTWLDAGKPKEFEISQGVGAYIHAVNKMTDGKMHLRAMGITEEDVAKIESKVDEKYIRFIDWLQDEFLPELWYRYNDVHQKVFGASLSKIDHYFPLKVNKNALVKQESIDDDGTISLPSTITGNIKTRTNNVAPLDLLNSNAFSVALQYMQEMEHWAAYVPMIKDLNALISYKPFRNKVKGMVTAYGNGNQTWETFLKCCRLAAGVYHPLGSGSEFDKYTVNLSKSLAAAKIALRVYTAFKQFFSAPAYLSDASPVFLAKNISNPVSWVMSWNWCYKNLPNFKKRWKSRIAGETRLLPSDKDWTMWSTKIADIASKIGLTPNAFVDALTVSIGAKSIYETRRYSYLRQGFPKDKAEAKARLDAEIAYNETQQSSGGMFVSPIQIDRTAEAFLRSTFRNASFAYERQVVQGLRNVRNMARYGQKEMVDYMTKQAVRDGADEDKARRYFKWEYKKAWVRENFRALLFGYGMQFAWYAGASMPYFFWGRDKKKIQNYLETSAINAAFGPVEGLPYGGTISSWGTKAVMGDKNAWRDPNVIGSTLLGDDVDNAIRLWGNDQMAAANETINLIVQMGIGVNPQTVWDVFLAVDDAVNGDPDIEREVLLCMMRVLQVPQSQVNEIFIDEMGLPASKCSELTVNQFAKRYAEYRMKRGAYVTRGGYSDAKKLDVLQKYEKQFKKYWKERIKLDEGEEAAKTKSLKQWKAEAEAALKSGDREGYETATRGIKSQKLQNAFKNAKKKLNDAIQAETDPAKRAKLEDKLRKLERDEQEKTVE